MTSLYKDAERLVLIIRPYVKSAVPTIDSDEDFSKLEYLLQIRSGAIKDKLKIERELFSLEERHYNSILENLHIIKAGKTTEDEKKAIEDRIINTTQAKDGDLGIARYQITNLEKELGTTLGAFEVMLNLLKDDPESFKTIYNRDRPKDDRGTPYSTENEVRVNLSDLVKKEPAELVPHVQGLVGPA